MNNEVQNCTICKEDKPYPEQYIASYKKMEMTSQCRDCRYEKKRKQKLENHGKPVERSSWKNSTSKIHP